MGTRPDANIKLSNVIGAPFSDYVLLQLYVRARHNSSINRSNEDVLFLANKTSWARLVSSVNIANDNLKSVYSNLKVDYSTSDGLAKNWILEAGTSKQKGNGISLRSGIGPDGAYGLGGTEEMGYRPMPGLTGVTIETAGRLGSLRQATIQFKVWNMNQLDVIEALYFRLGYSMLLEWGHTQYFNNNEEFQSNGIYGINDPFAPNQRKEQIQQSIALKARNSFGNYDGMLGIVSNFTWAMNQDGGYDCTVKLVGLGSVMDTMRINQAYKLPKGLSKQYQKNKDIIAQELKKLEKLRQELQYLKENASGKGTVIELDPSPSTVTQLYDYAKKYDLYKGDLNAFFKDYSIATLGEKYQFIFPAKEGVFVPTGDDVKVKTYAFNIPFTNNPAADAKAAYSKAYGGLWLNKAPYGWKRYTPDTLTSIKFDTGLLSKAINSLLEGNSNTGEYVRGIQQRLSSKIDAAYTKSSSKVTQYFAANTDSVEALNTTANVLKVISGGTAISSIETSNLFAIGTANTPLALTDAVPGNAVSVIYAFRVAPGRFDNFGAFSNSNVTIEASWTDSSWRPTRENILASLDFWQTNGSRLDNVTYTAEAGSKFKITGTFTQNVVASYNGLPENKDNAIKFNPGYNGEKTLKEVPVKFTVSTDNPGFIADVLTATPKNEAKPAATDAANNGNAGGNVSQSNTEQQLTPEGFASALQAMLIVVQAQAQAARATSTKSYVVVDITPSTKNFYQDGIMNGVLDANNTPSKVPNPSKASFNLVQYAGKGFNSQLMIDPTLYNTIPSVDFTTLCQAFAFAYNQGGEEGSTEMLSAPSYITFGYLLAFLNNMCLMYDSPDSKVDTTNNNSAKGTAKRPYVYIDFNPETNFCLTSPQQLSVDPTVCLIPLEATKTEYEAIFPENIVKNWSTDQDKVPPIFNPGLGINVVSGVIREKGLPFKGDNAYQGKIMNILLNIDYLLNLIQGFTGTDSEHAVRLEPFLQQILVDVNKCLGNTNHFRAAYRDDSNTIQIQDDQWVPSLVGSSKVPKSEINILSASTYNARLSAGQDSKLAGLIPISNSPKEIPVAGSLSLARQFQLRSVMSTKMASMIAISAQAATGSVNATDHSSLSYLNQNFQDRYKPYIQDASNGASSTNVDKKAKELGEANDQQAAEFFNGHIRSIYYDFLLNPDRINLAKNYYIERMSKVKSGDVITSAAPFIPAEVEMTLDGISGIIMGNAFTIPQDRLPLSLRGENGLAKIAFIVTGLTHTIQNNEWLTKIKGQMIKLRSENKITPVADIVGELADTSTTSLLLRYSDTAKSSLKGKALYSDAAFRAKLKTITDKYQINDEDLLKVMNAESGLDPASSLYLYYPKKDRATHRAKSQPEEGYKLFATGLIQFTSDNEQYLGKTLDEIRMMSAIDQLDLVDKYLKAYESKLRGGNIYVLYGFVFYPVAVPYIKANNDSYVIGSDRSTSYALGVSRDNPIIATTNGKKPGVDTITVADFKRYVNAIF